MVPSAYVRTTVITARPLTKKDLIFSMAFTIARAFSLDMVVFANPSSAAIPRLTGYCRSTFIRSAGSSPAPPYRIR